MDKPVDGAEAQIIRLAELQYHADGFTDMAKRGDLPEPKPWIAEALTAEHGGDCTKQPWSCMRCHAEDAMDVARWVYPRHSAALVAENERQAADIEFLLARSGHAGSCSFGGGRWTGMSSNALVAKAFGHNDGAMPSDSSDLAACYRAVMRLPAHRRTPAVFDHLEKAETHVEARYQESIAYARQAAEWPGRTALETRNG